MLYFYNLHQNKDNSKAAYKSGAVLAAKVILFLKYVPRKLRYIFTLHWRDVTGQFDTSFALPSGEKFSVILWI